MNKKVSVAFMLMAILFNVCLLISNLIATKVIMIGGFTATAGLIVFPISYIINDCIAEVWGFRKARLVIWSGFATNFLALLFYQAAIAIPAASFWDGQEAFTSVLAKTPRLAVASLLAFLVGSFTNAYIMSRMKLRAQIGKGFSLRAIVSTFFGEGLDSIVFFSVVFWGELPMSAIAIMIGSQTIMKSGYEMAVLPLTRWIVKKIKQIEGVDVYDKGISYNILNINQL